MSESEPSRRKPTPPAAEPGERREPLPWQHPKEREDDPDAPARVQALLASPSYREAEKDAEFLNLDATRGIRLQIDYAKPELLMSRHGIESTIVVFGSTRIVEPSAARRRLDDLEQRAAERPGDAELERRCRCARRVLEKSSYYDVARELGRLVGRAGRDDGGGSKLVVLTGGGPGIMEAANRGAFDVDAESIGLNISLPHEQYPNPYITPDLCFQIHYFAVRKLHFLLRAKALVAFPGGYGTFDELFETLTLVQTRRIRPVPIVLVGEAYWSRAVDFDFLVEEGVIAPEDRNLFWFAETAEEIWDGIRQWYAARGEPLT